jgi:hypothetical protein
MKISLKLIIIALMALFIFACENDDNGTDTATIQVSNLSSNPANLWIHNAGSSSVIAAQVPASSSATITINDGDAGLDVYGGRAIIDFRHVINNEEVYEAGNVFADLDPDFTASVTIDNNWGCLDIESYSQTAEMWVNIDGGATETIPVWGDLTKFYDPTGNSVSKAVDYNGYTLFAGSTSITVYEDQYSRLDIYPDAGCFWINNNSTAFYITEVYLSPSYETQWGPNDLFSDIPPGEFFTWSCTPDIEWDLMVVDNWDDSFTFFNLMLNTDDVYTYDYTGFPAALNPDPHLSKKLNAANHQQPRHITPRLEPNQF